MLRSGRLFKSRPVLLALVAGGTLTGLFVAGLGEAQDPARLPAFAGPPSFADVVEQVNPAVVTVAVTKDAAVWQTFSGGAPRAEPFGDFPFEDFFGFGLPDSRQAVPAPRPSQGEGSGFVIDPAGYIATNYHVVEGARDVTVRFASGEQVPATVVGTDPRTDLALIRIDDGRRLPALRFGDSDQARVGEWVLAIGNPFGLGGSATAGIISARGRDIQSGPYDDYLQIDAAINSGNSGGPVFNSAGEVIGINTAIFSPTGGNVGIGFAIPSNRARSVLDELREDGSVSRGWLGIEMAPDDEVVAEGVVVYDVFPDGPAATAGLRRGDVIVRFDGEAIDSNRVLGWLVASLDAGDDVEIEILRDGERRELTAELGMLDEARLQAAAEPSPEPRQQPFRQPSPRREPYFRR